MSEATAKILPFKAPNETGHPAPSAACRRAARGKRVALTVELILNIERPAADADNHNFLWDSIVPGFGAYKTKHDVCSYLVKTKAGKRVVLGQLDDPKWPATPAANIKAARAAAFQLLERAEAGEVISKRPQLGATPAGGLTVALAYQLYITNKKGKKKKPLRPDTLKTYNTWFAHLAPWHNREIWSITKAEVVALAQKLWEKGDKKGGAVRGALGLFSYVWGYHAALSEKALPMCPTVVLEAHNLWPTAERRSRNLVTDAEGEEDDQLRAWLQAVHQMTEKTNKYGDAWWTFSSVVYFIALLLTGGRRSEMLYAQWKDYDAKTGVWRFPGTTAEYDAKTGWQQKMGTFVGNKSDRDHKVYVGPYLKKLLAKLYAMRSDGQSYMFGTALDLVRADDPPNAVAQFRKAFPKLRKWSCHDLRRTYLSVMNSKELQAQIPLKAMKLLVNHESNKVDVTLGYIKISDADMRVYAKKVEAAILARAGVKS